MRYAKEVTMKKQRNYDKRVKNTRILLSDWLILKRMSQVSGISMSEALHRLIEHQAQLPMIDRLARPIPVIVTKSMPTFRVSPQPVLAVNGHKAGVFVIKPKGGILDG